MKIIWKYKTNGPGGAVSKEGGVKKKQASPAHFHFIFNLWFKKIRAPVVQLVSPAFVLKNEKLQHENIEHDHTILTI